MLITKAVKSSHVLIHMDEDYSRMDAIYLLEGKRYPCALREF